VDINILSIVTKIIPLSIRHLVDGPESVSLKGVSRPLTADEEVIVECEVHNSRPAAQIIWSPAELFQEYDVSTEY